MNSRIVAAFVSRMHSMISLPELSMTATVNRANVGMFESRRGLGFALKTGQRLRVFGYFVGQEFQSYEAVELDVLGLVDDTHTSAAKLFDDAIVRDGLADHGIEPW